MSTSTILKAYILGSKSVDQRGALEIWIDVWTPHGAKLLVYDQQKYVFFVERESQYQISFEHERKQVNLVSFNNRPVDALYFNSQEHGLSAREKLESQGVRTYEADIRAHERFCMERSLMGHVELNIDPSEANEEVLRNVAIRACQSFELNLKALSFDIETGSDGSLYSISLDFCSPHNSERSGIVLMRGEGVNQDWVHFFPNEEQLIKEFLKLFHSFDPDFIYGWNVVGFDMQFLFNKSQKLGISFNLSRFNGEFRLDSRNGTTYAQIQGRWVFDGPPLLRNNFFKFSDYKLETVAREVLGLGKEISESGNSKVLEIERQFREDKLALAKYNLVDSQLVSDIYHKLNITALVMARQQLSGQVLDRQGMSVASFDYLYLPKLHRRGIVAPNGGEIDSDYSSGGGKVLTPDAGGYEHIAIFDFKSLYPSIIRTFEIDPLSRLCLATELISTPVEIKFSRSDSILPRMLQDLMSWREEAKIQKNNELSQAIKILMNSFYGILGSRRSRFYHADLPNAITSTGQYILTQAVEYFNNHDLKVIYGDTDSVFVKFDSRPNEEEIAKWVSKANDFFRDLLKSNFKVDSKLELEFEKYYPKFFVPKARDNAAGARKKYVGLEIINGEMRLEFKGMEFVRSDWTQLAKNFQFQLMKNYFEQNDIEKFIKSYCQDLEDGKFDNDLAYTKKLTKELSEYDKSVPVHVQAARQIDHKGPYRLKSVSYIITKSGPVPIQNSPTQIDYQHYIEKQIRPVADSVLMTMGKSFDAIMIGDQLSFI